MRSELIPERSIMQTSAGLVLIILMCVYAGPGHTQAIRVDFVREIPGKFVDLAVNGQGHVYLLSEDGVVTVVRPPEEPRRILLRENVNKPFSFDSPKGIAVDRRGNIFICDGKAGIVAVFDSHGTYISHFGPALARSDALDYPMDLAVDLFGRVFVVDKNHYVHMYNNQGVYLGRMTDFRDPVDIGIDGFGHIYVLDSGESALTVYDVHFDKIETRALGSLTDSEFKSPEALFIEPDGTVYITDTRTNAVMAYSPVLLTDVPVRRYARIGIEGEGRGEFRKPISVAVDGSGRLYVADGKNDNVQVFEFSGLAEQKRRIESPARWSLPVTVEWNGDIRHANNPHSTGLESFAVDDDGTIYCVDSGTHSISVYQPDGRFVMTFGKEGDDPGRMRHPRGAVVIDNTDLFVLDSGNHRIQHWSKTGIFQRQIGSKGRKPVEFNEPHDLALGPDSALVIADTKNNRVQIIGTDGELRTVVGSVGTERLESPIGVAVDPGGRIYIAEEDRAAVKMIDPVDETTGIVGDTNGSPFDAPVSLAVDDHGTLFVLDAETGIFALDGGSRLVAHFSSLGNLIGQFMQPTHIRIAPRGDILVADATHNRISSFRLGNLTDGAAAGTVAPKPSRGTISLYRDDILLASDSLHYDGSYLIGEVEPGEVTVTVEAPGFTHINTVTATVSAGSVVRCKPLLLEENGGVSGIVIPPARDAMVTLLKNREPVAEIMADPDDGIYRFGDIRPDAYALDVKAPGYAADPVPKEILIESGVVLSDTLFLKRPGTAGGVVTPPEAGAMGTILIDSVTVARFAVRSDNGVFETPELYPGFYSLELRADEFMPWSRSGIEIGEGERLDLGVIELERVKTTTQEALRLLAAAKDLHLSADFKGAQAALDSAITSEEMSNPDLAEAKLWLAYSYFPFSDKRDAELAALREALTLDPDITVDESFSPGFIRDIEAVKRDLNPQQNDE